MKNIILFLLILVSIQLNSQVVVAIGSSQAIDSTNVGKLSPNNFAQTGANINDVLTWTGSKYAPRPVSAGGSSQWTTSGSNIYFNTGYIGLGITSPTAVIHVSGSYNLNSFNPRFLNFPTVNLGSQSSYHGFESIASTTLGANNQQVTAFNGLVNPTMGSFTLNSSALPAVFRAQTATNANILQGLQGNPTTSIKPAAIDITQSGSSNTAPAMILNRSNSANGDIFQINQPRVSTENPFIVRYAETGTENQGDRIDLFRMSSASKSFAGIFKHYKVDINSATYTTAFAFEIMDNNSLVNTLKIVGGNVIIGGDATTTQAGNARLQLPAGSATALKAPLKFTSGTNLTTPEAGAIEYDGTEFYATPSNASRFILARVLKSGSQALTFGSVSAGSNISQTYTFTGAATTDALAYNYDWSPAAGCTVTARVSAANTILVTVVNASSVSVTVPTINFTFTVIK